MEQTPAQKLILLDVDGTLIGMDGIIPPSAVTACRKARDKGHLLYLCTGRAMMEIPEKLMSIDFDGIASSGGAHIESGGKVLFDTTMPLELAKQIVAYLESRQCGFTLEKNYMILSNSYFIAYWKKVKASIDPSANISTLDDLIAKTTKNPLPENPDDSYYEGANKIVFVGSGSVSLDAVKKAFGDACEIFAGSFPLSGKESGEIGPLGVHKGSALQKIAEHCGIPIERTIAFGDSDNDRPMLERAAIGVAMGNATSALKKIADDVTSPLADDGIYHGFVKHALI
jgi:Cof subfamily protein (haloacid dehalogenase superfamily)